MKLASTPALALGLLLAAAAAHAADPFQATTNQVAIPDGVLEGCHTVMTVPAGQRFVVEYASASLQVPSTQRPWGQMLRTTVDGTTAYHMLSTEPTGVNNTWLVTSALRLHADPGTSVDFCYHRSAGTGTMWMLATVSGVLAVAP